MKTLRWICLIGLTTLALAASGCGDDGSDGDPQVDAPPGNGEPTATFTMTPDCTSAATDEITFTSTSTDPDGDTLTCDWVFGSGTPSSGSECTVDGVTFPNAAPYPVTLTVQDGNGGEATTTMNIGPC